MFSLIWYHKYHTNGTNDTLAFLNLFYLFMTHWIISSPENHEHILKTIQWSFLFQRWQWKSLTEDFLRSGGPRSKHFLTNTEATLARWLSWLECLPYTKGLWFPSWSGHIPRLQVWSPFGALTGGNQSFSFLSLLFFPPSLPPSSPSFLLFFFYILTRDMFIDFRDRERERDIDWVGPLIWPQLGLEPATYICVLTGVG